MSNFRRLASASPGSMLGAKGISMPKRYLALLVGAFVLVPQWESASAQMDFGLDEAEGGEAEAEPIPEEEVPTEEEEESQGSGGTLSDWGATPPPASTGTTPAAGEGMGVIQVLSGGNAGRELLLTKSLTTLGKPGRQVAVITRRPHGYFITHVEGASFPLVNGNAIDAQARPLRDHDIIEIAGVKMEFFLRG